MLKELVSTNPDGSPHYRFELTQDEHDSGLVALMTGPIAGPLTLDDGTTYDVTDTFIPVKREHVGPLHIAIVESHHANGRFLDVPVPKLEDVSL
jgi:hypothetical protein